MIALSNDLQRLSFDVGAGSGDNVEFTVHVEGAAQRLVGRSGGTTRAITRANALNGISGQLDFGVVTDVLQGPNLQVADSAVVQTITLHNPSAAAVDIEVQFRDDDISTSPATIVRNTMWAFTLEVGETWTYTYGVGTEVTPELSEEEIPDKWGFLSGSTLGQPILITAITSGTAQAVHTVGAAPERVWVSSAANAAGPIATSLWIGGTAVGNGWEASSGNRGRSTLIDGEVIGAGSVLLGSAAVASQVSLMGRFEKVALP